MTALVWLFACGRTALEGTTEAPHRSPDVALIWRRSHAAETWAQASSGLAWQLTLLGALPNNGDWLEVDRQVDDRVDFTLHLDRVGLSSMGLEATLDALAEVEDGADLGLFMMRTVYSPWHYYQITGACVELDDWRSRLELAATFPVTQSAVVAGHRELTLVTEQTAVEGIAAMLSDGEGDVEIGSFEALEFETMDVMDNGQLRFAVYDERGELVPAATPSISPAGAPGSCHWCHEGHPMEEGAAPFGDTFDGWIGEQWSLIQDTREQLVSDVDWTDPTVHAAGEMLAHGWLYPNIERLSNEWEIEPAEVERRLSEELQIAGAEDWEHPELGEIFARVDLDAGRGGAEVAYPSHWRTPTLASLPRAEAPVCADAARP